HINIPFEEPLYETVPELTSRLAFVPEIKEVVTSEDLTAFAAAWNASSKKMILTGVNDPGVLSQDLIDFIGNEASVVVMTETTSNLHHPNFIAHIDTLITPFSEKAFLQLQPEILVTFGGMVVSKRVKAFLRKYKPKQHWHIDVLRAYDTFGALTSHIKQTPQNFFSFLKEKNKEIASDYAKEITAVFDYRTGKHWHFLEQAPFSDLKAYERILEALPAGSMLQISNSAAIRYAQLVPFDNSISVYCNRGTSGIDGSTSTAIGAAVASPRQTVLLTGDIGFFYDSNALWNNYIPSNFRIILVNNGGGGIFRILPGHKENTVFNRFFETSHHLDASHLAEMYHFDYYTANDEQELGEALRCLFSEGGKPAILEVFTPEKLNDKILADYFRALA
ncbi:MAG: 2-succinyl-5-enolpyruvyl-6-hydroxy-3-cyclohexene-1-carboxylate synthase, partial [Chitinophagaceae bacterium]